MIAINDPLKRTFYEAECVRGNWSARELKRHIASVYYECSGLPMNKEKLAELVRARTDHTQCMDACLAVFKRGGYNFYLPPYKCASPGQTATKDRKADQVVFLDASVPDCFIEGNGAGS